MSEAERSSASQKVNDGDREPNDDALNSWHTRVPVSLNQIAFHTGRLFNCVNFDAKQAFVLYGVGLHEPARDKLAQTRVGLARLRSTAQLVAASKVPEVFCTLDAFRDRLSTAFGSREHELHLESLQDRMDAIGDELPVVELRDALVEYEAAPALTGLYHAMLDYFGEATHEYFQLGRVLDEGVRPSNVHERMFDRSTYQVGRGNFLANSIRSPGELTPVAGWDTAICSLLSRLLSGFSPDLNEQRYAAMSFANFVDAMDIEIRRRLAATQEPKSEAKCPEAPRLTVDVKTCRAVLDGEGETLTSNGAIYLKAVLDGDGELVSGLQIAKALKTTEFKVTRAWKSLPKRFQDLVEVTPNGSKLRRDLLA